MGRGAAFGKVKLVQEQCLGEPKGDRRRGFFRQAESCQRGVNSSPSIEFRNGANTELILIYS